MTDFSKVRELIIPGTEFEEAEKVANEMFGDNKLAADGSRTTEDVKVRIKRRGSNKTNVGSSFRVMLYKRGKTSPVKEKEELASTPKKVKPRARNDRKGRRYNHPKQDS